MTPHRNRFQRWAGDYAGAFGWRVMPKGDWVVLSKGRQAIECMCAAGVQHTCDFWKDNG